MPDRSLVPRAAPDHEPGDEFGIRQGLLWALIGWVVGVVGGGLTFQIVLAVTGTPADEANELSLGWVAVAQAGLWAGLLGVPVVVSRLYGSGPVRDYGLRILGRDIPLGLVWGVVSQIAVIFVVYLPFRLLDLVDPEEISQPARDLTDRATDPVGVALLVLIVGIGAPIAEEIFYRGLLQRSLIRRLGDWPGLIITALLFGGAHFQLLQFPALAVFGLVLGVLTYRTGRLGPAIVAHVGFNMAAVVNLLVSS